MIVNTTKNEVLDKLTDIYKILNKTGINNG